MSGRGRGQPAAMPGRGRAVRPVVTGAEPVAGRGRAVRPAQPAQVAGVTQQMAGLAMRPAPPQAVAPVAVSEAAPPADEMARVTTRESARAEIRKTRPLKSLPSPDSLQKFFAREIDVTANYFKMNSMFETFFQFIVSFSPSVDNKSFRKKLVHSISEKLGPVHSFDGLHLFLVNDLDQNEFTVTSNQGQEYKINLVLVRKFKPTEDPSASHQVYNLVMRRAFDFLKLTLVGQNFFNTDEKSVIDIPEHNMQLWPGYSSSISNLDGGCLFNLDIVHKVFRKSTVLDIFKSCRSDEDKSDIIRGSVVITLYNNKTYKIQEIDFKQTPMSTFDTVKGPVTYVDYYKQKYSKTISDRSQPLLKPKPKKRFASGQEGGKRQETSDDNNRLIPELCFKTGLDDQLRSDNRVMRALATKTIAPPSQRIAQLSQFVDGLYRNAETKQLLSSWKMNISNELVSVKGLVLKPETITLGGGKKVVVDAKSADWSRDLKNARVNEPVNVNDWIIVFSERFNSNEAKMLVDIMMKESSKLGIRMDQPKIIPLKSDRGNDYLQALESNCGPSCQLVVCLLPDTKSDRYAAVKKFCVTKRGIVSQCVLAKTMKNEKVRVAAVNKIVLQINIKLGGELWNVTMPVDGCMFIGIDVHHDTLRKDKSVVGMVASVNKNVSHFYSAVSILPGTTEIVRNLTSFLEGALRKYKMVNQKLPSQIVIFRDGVGEGQFDQLASSELKTIQSTISKVFNNEGAAPAKLAFFVIQKRISTRLMVNTGREVANPPPGTVVYTGITDATYYDYFLVPQPVRQGTVTPCKFNLIFNNTAMKPEHFFALSFKLTHMYFNWPGTIRVPSPCMYAHKIAFLVGESIHQSDIKEELQDKLFYL